MINLLVDDDIALSSKTPGRTRRINFYTTLENRLFLADLPGYGYAEANKELVEDWNKLVQKYLTKRKVLRRTFVLLDCRFGIQKIDEEFLQLMEFYGVSVQLVLTKCDKVDHEHLCKTMKAIYERLEKHEFLNIYPVIIPTSAIDDVGVDMFRAHVLISSGLLEMRNVEGLTEEKVNMMNNQELAKMPKEYVDAVKKKQERGNKRREELLQKSRQSGGGLPTTQDISTGRSSSPLTTSSEGTSLNQNISSSKNGIPQSKQTATKDPLGNPKIVYGLD